MAHNLVARPIPCLCLCLWPVELWLEVGESAVWGIVSDVETSPIAPVAKHPRSTVATNGPGDCPASSYEGQNLGLHKLSRTARIGHSAHVCLSTIACMASTSKAPQPLTSSRQKSGPENVDLSSGDGPVPGICALIEPMVEYEFHTCANAKDVSLLLGHAEGLSSV